jgi:hypothetical protein
MAGKRIRIGRLDTAGGIAYEHGKILKKLMRQMIDPALASRLSGMFVNQSGAASQPDTCSNRDSLCRPHFASDLGQRQT